MSSNTLDKMSSESSESSTAAVLNKKTKNRGIPDNLTRDDFDGGPPSLDEIEKGLWLGNVTAAMDTKILESKNITHILTVDSCPLPNYVTDLPNITSKYIQISDMPKEDILIHFEETNAFINSVISQNKNILVHCYFGVSRSATIVLAYVMQKHKLNYDRAFDRVKSQRRFVFPNAGFVSQLRLYQKMDYRIDTNNSRYKVFRLKLAADQIKKAKILPRNYMNLIKPDPGITQEVPEPVVYRCKKCRRIVAAKSNLLFHQSKIPVEDDEDTEELNKQAAAKLETLKVVDQFDYLSDRIRNNSIVSEKEVVIPPKEKMKSVVCDKTYFLEPLSWMNEILNNTQGRLYCPKCTTKLGSFNWIMACKCPCGEEVSPAFYLVPSKVEYSNVVQNVQITV